MPYMRCGKTLYSQKGHRRLWRMCFACWIIKATDTHSEYVIITAFPPQQWLSERVSMLRYTYDYCQSNVKVSDTVSSVIYTVN
jgi:hypothetical protein